MAIPNPFNPREQGEMNLKRNAYDLSRTNLFTSHWGRVTPCFLQEVIPGDSFQLDNLSLAVQGMPTVFPLQTRVRVSVEFYYGRNRCVFDGFEDFIFKTKDVEQPWLRLTQDRAKEMISTGSLGDMFGIPTTHAAYALRDFPIKNSRSLFVGAKAKTTKFNTFTSSSYNSSLVAYFKQYTLDELFSASDLLDDETSLAFASVVDLSDLPYIPDSLLSVTLGHNASLNQALWSAIFVDGKFVQTYNPSTYNLPANTDGAFEYPLSSISSLLNDLHSSGHKVSLVFLSYVNFSDTVSLAAASSSNSLSIFGNPKAVSVPFFFPLHQNLNVSEITDSTDDSFITNNPFIGGTPDIKLNALPFRHYEQICNYYYRNDKNNPYYLNGEVQYNDFIPTHAAGADDNVYSYHYKNWELDRFTSALQSPQFGEAPLVGLTFTGDKTATLEFEQDGHTYTAEVGVDSNDVVETIQNFSQDIPSANLRKLQEMINYGISINDLRVTNSFQRFLENVMRRGLRYRNQLKSHFGVGVDYPDIDIPQYIGGFSGDLTVGKTTSMAQTSEASLGDFNGQLSGLLQAKHSIHCYCPEHGFIIGMVTITPVPVYTQTCNKVMIKQDPFDYYLPEFGKIGFVPMHYSEVMPLQTPANGSVDDVFGYQKAHYDYMQAYDEAHSFFRTNLKDFVLQRTFAERPTLVEDFTVINPEQLSDVFITQNIADKYNVSDKFLCNFYAHVVAKRPIPRVGTPSLE